MINFRYRIFQKQKRNATPELKDTEVKMTTTKLSDKQLNFAYVALACVDIIKLPLIDILRSSIEPQDLREAVQKCNPLMKGRFRLRPEQKAKCGFTSPNQSPKTPTPPPNYNDFDVTLVSALIQNLCSQFQPPTSQQSTNKQLWEEIKEVRRIKNNCLSHIGSGQLDKTTFDDIWNSMENVIKRIQTLTKSNTNRLKELDDLKHKTVKSTEYESLIEKLKGKFAMHTQMHLRPVEGINQSNKYLFQLQSNIKHKGEVRSKQIHCYL